MTFLLLLSTAIPGLLCFVAARVLGHRVSPRIATAAGSVLVAGALYVFWPAWRACFPNDCGWHAGLAAARANGAILDADGDTLALYRSSRHAPLDQIPPDARVFWSLIEDRDFEKSRTGISFRGLLRSLWHLVRRPLPGALGGTDGLQGGSTITMQLVEHWPGNPYRIKRSIPGKLRELVLAVDLAQHLTRDEVWELYINRIPLGGPTRGIEEASDFYFGQDPNDLSLGEIALLTGMTSAPDRYSPCQDPLAAWRKRNFILNTFSSFYPARAREIENAKREPLRVRCSRKPGKGDRDALRSVTAYSRPDTAAMPAVIPTTLDGDLQEAAREGLDRLVREIEAQRFGYYASRRANPLQSAFVAMTPDGAIRAYVCGRSDQEHDELDRCGRAQIQPESLVKPFQLAALGSVRDTDRLYELASRGDGFCFTDEWAQRLTHDEVARGYLTLTVREAMTVSSNLLGCLQHRSLGRDGVAKLHSIGLEVDPDNSMHAIGTGLTASPMRLLPAFTSLMTGVWVQPTLSPDSVGKTRSFRVWDAETVDATRRALHDVVWIGTAHRAARFLKPTDTVFLKTGTGDDSRSFVVAGYFPRSELVVFAWIGHDRPRPINPSLHAGDVLAPAVVEIVTGTSRRLQE
jgi:membrane peptidoglycan carboxypeptidase